LAWGFNQPKQYAMPHTPDQPALSLDNAEALSRAWGQAFHDPDVARAKAQQLLGQMPPSQQALAGALSLGLEAVHHAAVWTRGEPSQPLIQRLREQALTSGHVRAQWLIDDALVGLAGICLVDPAADLLRAEALYADEARTQRPPFERIWGHLGLLRLLVANHRFDDALKQAMAACDCANQADDDVLRVHADFLLAFVFLAVGDLEGSEPVLERARARALAWGGKAALRAGLDLSLIVTYCMRGCADKALAMAQDWPGHDQPLLSGRLSRLRSGLALMQLGLGRPELADRLLGDGPHDSYYVAHSIGLWAWVKGRVQLALGHHRYVLDVARHQIEALESGATRPIPLNSTQLHSVLAQAHEEAGDFKAALQACRASQLSCFHWVAQSMGMRLTALQHEIDQPSDSALHKQRLIRVQAVAKAAIAEVQRPWPGTGEEPAPTSAAAPHGSPLRFVAHVSHEMRTPIAGVLGMTSLLMLSELDARQQRYVSLAQTSARMLLALCDDLLDLAKIEAGRFELVTQAFDLRELVDEVVQTVRPLTRSVQVQIDAWVDATVPGMLLGDPLRTRQILLNLLGNAAKFTAQGRIDLRIAARELGDGVQQLRIDVSDTGIGMSAEVCAKLFNEFTQADASIATSYGGSGLGLALCRQLAQLMGGQISVQSQPGMGSVFTVLLHMAAA
jgi:signal transduction histidine kinase